jgi:threonine dehydrogenase-like Zn-dependent dehydrogenase
MLALVNTPSPRVVADAPRPERRAGEARVRVRVAGICDTDLQLAKGYMSYSGTLGHEFVGEVVEADTPGLVGRRVVADINAGCGRCADCRERQGHHCASRTVLGIAGRDGAIAEEFAVPERNLVQLPDSLSDERAVFAEPLAAALHVLDVVPAELSTPVVVLGDGKLGVLIARALRGAGLRVVVVGHHAEKLALAAAVGAETRLEREIDPGRDASDVVVEATGSPSGLALALRLTRPLGTLVLKTTVAGQVSVDVSSVVVNELRVVGSRCGDIQRAVDVLARGEVDPTPLIAARYPLAQADRALARAGEKGVLKVLVENT